MDWTYDSVTNNSKRRRKPLVSVSACYGGIGCRDSQGQAEHGNSQDRCAIAATDEPSESKGDYGWVGEAGISARVSLHVAQRSRGDC